MQRLFLLLTVIISRAIASPVAQIYPDGSFDIALSGFGDSNIAAPEPFQLAETDAPKKAPNPPQPGDPVIRKQPQPKPKISTEENNPEEEPKVRNQPFDCGEGKSGACCIGVTHEGITSGCVKFMAWDDWCQQPESFKCCKGQPEKDRLIQQGKIQDDYFREDCEDPKEVTWSTQQKLQNFGNDVLRMIVPDGINTGLSVPKGVWVPNQ